MTKAGDCFVLVCATVKSIPAEALCVLLFLVQAASLNYFLVTSFSINHLAWIGPDIFNLFLLLACIIVTYRALCKNKDREDSDLTFAWVPWLFMNAVLAAKTMFLYYEIASELEEKHPSFFGPNALKTSVSLSSCIFILLLTTQHDAPMGSERRLYIEELTGTVVFDIIDTVDILDILFEEEAVDSFSDGLHEFILAVATMNLLIPTLPLLILSRTKFGHRKLTKDLVYAHKWLVVLLVNVPNLLVRAIVWHGFSGAISAFTIKNVILICMTIYEFYLHKKEKYKQHEQERKKQKHTLETSNGFSHETNSEDTKSDNERYIPESFGIQSRIQTDV